MRETYIANEMGGAGIPKHYKPKGPVGPAEPAQPVGPATPIGAKRPVRKKAPVQPVPDVSQMKPRPFKAKRPKV